ncbi:MAG: class I SAM-dependent methyltransferase, partial [Opitutaceae bacterium]
RFRVDSTAAREDQHHPALIDLGCGRGEWLDLLRARDVSARGVDLSNAFVDDCRSRMLDVVRMDAVSYLSKLPDRCVAAVTSFHLVEHLDFSTLLAMLRQAFRVLAPGGVIILESPNPENLLVSCTTFHQDPTHRRPLPPGLLEFAVSHIGFTNTSVQRSSPYPEEFRLEPGTESADRLNNLLYGPQDYAVIAERSPTS